MTSERMLERDEEMANWLRDKNVSMIRANLPPEGTVGPEDCAECANDIPLLRRQHGFSLCVECANRRERNVR